MQIASWNVAGWWPTVEKIKKYMGLSIEDFLNKHNADIFCIQEAKISQRKLENFGRSISLLNGYESFWGFNTDSETNGFQGVTTYARKGLTIRACNEPFIEEYKQLNRFGRCILTEHSSFILFNIYAPLRNEDMRVNFFNGLWSSINHWRTKTGKEVILCGDMNLTLHKLDRHYSNRLLRLEDLQKSKTVYSCKEVKNICIFWSRLKKILLNGENLLVSRVKTSSGRTKYRLKIKWNGKSKAVGRLQFTREEAMTQYDYMFKNAEDIDVAMVHDIRHLLSLLEGLNFPDFFWKGLSDDLGKMLTNPHIFNIMKDGMMKNNMKEPLREKFPQMDFRFTCWNQSENKRFSNIGSRIDYFILSEDLVVNILKSKTDWHMSCPCGSCKRFSHNEGLCCATSGGNYKEASVEGGGLRNENKKVLFKQFRAKGHGFIYTPPDFSDHIGISLLLDKSSLLLLYYFLEMEDEKCVLDNSCKITKKTQPVKAQKTISSFFKARN
eukprot:maker-scaffold_1-snap-gene-24.15-mRNA-1 protein AED:0.02 eAED:0.02 QI:0/0/0/1/1/1/3/0/494